MNSQSQNKAHIFSALQRYSSSIRAFGVKKLGLFGSFVRDEQRPESDVDILVVFEDGRKNFDNFMKLNLMLEDILQREVELVTPESLSPYMKTRILQEAEYASFLS